MHFGIICPPVNGHMNPGYAYGHELVRRGHRVTAVGFADARRNAQGANLEFACVGTDVLPEGAVTAMLAKAGRLRGVRAMGEFVRFAKLQFLTHLDEAPTVFARLGLDAVLADQMCPGAGTASDVARVPYVTVCSAVMLEPGPKTPPPGLFWKYGDSAFDRVRIAIANWTGWKLFGTFRRKINQVRRRHGLPLMTRPDQYSSPFATVSQLPRAFDLPRERLPATFHYAGPFTDPDIRGTTPFPWDKLDGRPLIYASLGTLQNRIASIFQRIAEACVGRDAQLVISLGRRDAEIPARMPGDPIVVAYAPQLDLVRRASLVITHAGLNTVLESLACGVPVVAIPITNDQPGVATRVLHHKVGAALSPQFLTVGKLRAAIDRVFSDGTYRQNAATMQRAIAEARGLERAAEIAEQVAATRQPVLRSGEK